MDHDHNHIDDEDDEELFEDEVWSDAQNYLNLGPLGRLLLLLRSIAPAMLVIAIALLVASFFR